MNKEKKYAPLHIHSHYSILDGYATIEEYVATAKSLGLPGLGLSDHGSASGLYKFITTAQKEGLVAVPGVEFYVAPENAKGAECLNPIYYGENGRAAKYDVSNGAYTHMTVFAYNNTGLSNLFKLTSMSWLPKHFYFRPRIDTNMLAEHSEGLIVTTGCPSSEVNRRFLLNQDDKAYEYASRLKSIFGDNLYIEVMNHNMEDEDMERILIPKQIKISRDLGIKMIATNDSHYAFREDAEPHERVLAVSTKSKMKELPFHKGGRRFSFSTKEYYIKTYNEMIKSYPSEIAEELLDNTLEIMNKCKDIKLEYDPHLRPEIDIPEGYSPATYLQKLIFDGYKIKRGHESKEIQEESVKRIKEEFEVLHSNDFISYFLVVHDYISYAHENNIGVGAGRGSVGGSEIAYVLDISNTDPIRFNLLFERFLSPGRGSLYQIDYVSGESEEIPVSSKKQVMLPDGTENVVYIHELYPGDTVNYGENNLVIKDVFVKIPGSAPDIDTDFHTEGREQVVKYCVDKYGENNVANIITFGTFKAKRAFKAMCTIYDVPFAMANTASNFIPGTQGAEASLREIMDPSSPRYNEGADFRNAVENSVFDEVVDMAIDLDGRISETGVHPCGVIISNQPLAGIIPTQVRQSDNKIITQWEYPELEALGLIKMDLLGLELINTIQQTVENIRLTNESAKDSKYVREIPDMRELILGPMDDKLTFETLQEGNTVGIFQLGSPGVRDLLKKAKPETFMEIANITALYRPGPMKSGAPTQYADRKSGKESLSYIHEDFLGTEVQDILEETFGLLIFQEQIMLIAGRYAGFAPYDTDQLRSAIGKKKMAKMMKMKPLFIKGCMSKGCSKEAAEILWDTIEVFGQYGFNKSHSVSYAINIYQTVYLKTHYPSEFMAALIQQGFGNPNKVRSSVQEAMRMQLKLGPVDINTSQIQVASTGADPSNKYNIVFGFSGIRQTNEVLANAIVEERNKNGEFKSVSDFIGRIIKTYPLSAAPLSNMALAGAFDSFGVSRKQVSEKAKMLIDSSNLKSAKGASLFDMVSNSNDTSVTDAIEITGEDYGFNELIKKEAEAIGMFVSGHPTSKLGHIATRYQAKTLSEIYDTGGSKEEFSLLGTVTQMESKTNKSGNRSIALLIDDGVDTVVTYLPKSVVHSIEKYEELEKKRKAIEKGVEYKVSKRAEQIAEIISNPKVVPMKSVEVNDPYLFKVKTRGWGDNIKIVVNDIIKLDTAPDGSLPYEVNVANNSMVNKVEKMIINHADKEGAYVRLNLNDKNSILLKTRVKLSLDFIIDMENIVGKENIVTEGI